MGRAEEILASQEWSRKNFPGTPVYEEPYVDITSGLILLDPTEGIYQNSYGIKFKLTIEGGDKHLTRIISDEERQEIENNWPKT